MAYVIRSMSTTDYVVGSPDKVVPYHVYLLPPEERCRAYWSTAFRAQKFATPQAAQAEADRLKLNGGQIVPADFDGPDYWDLDAMNFAAGIGYPKWGG